MVVDLDKQQIPSGCTFYTDYNCDMDAPLDEHAFDFLEPAARRLVKDMLAAVVEHPDIHTNGFTVTRLRDGSGFDYFLGLRGGKPSPFQNHQRLPDNVAGPLLYHRIIQGKRDPQMPDGWYSFTDAAMDWHRRFGGPDPDEIRKRIGRFIRHSSPLSPIMFRVPEVAAEIGVVEERVAEQTLLLLNLGLIEVLHRVDDGFGVLALSNPDGLLWAESGYLPVLGFPRPREVPLSAVPSLVRPPATGPGFTPATSPPRFDVFISHASEDKDEVVRPLAQALRDQGLAVWYDEFELRIGDSLRRKIDSGLANSRFGIVVLSDAFFRKGWPNHELDGLVAMSVGGEQAILPIWHKISKAEVVRYSPSLADRVARSTANYTVEEIASEIVEVIRTSRQ